MADEKPGLHIDTDWKKQAQEEKRKLAEEAAKRSESSPASGGPIMGGMSMPAAGAGGADAGAAPAGTSARAAVAARPIPQASFASLVQSLLTQVLLYLGELGARGGEPMINLDMAKHLIDTMGVLEEKTQGNLSDEEKKLIDTALYESRMRFVNLAAQIIG